MPKFSLTKITLNLFQNTQFCVKQTHTKENRVWLTLLVVLNNGYSILELVLGTIIMNSISAKKAAATCL